MKWHPNRNEKLLLSVLAISFILIGSLAFQLARSVTIGSLTDVYVYPPTMQYDYTIVQFNSTYYCAKNGTSGNYDYGSSDAGTLMNLVCTALSSSGGSVELVDATFWTSQRVQIFSNTTIVFVDSTWILNPNTANGWLEYVTWGGGTNAPAMFYAIGQSNIYFDMQNSWLNGNIANQTPALPANPGTELDGLFFQSCNNVTVPNFRSTGCGGAYTCTGVGLYLRGCNLVNVGNAWNYNYGSVGVSTEGCSDMHIGYAYGCNYSHGVEWEGGTVDFWNAGNSYGYNESDITIDSVVAENGGCAVYLDCELGNTSGINIGSIVANNMTYAALYLDGVGPVQNSYLSNVHVGSVVDQNLINDIHGDQNFAVYGIGWNTTSTAPTVHDITVDSVTCYNSYSTNASAVNGGIQLYQCAKVKINSADLTNIQSDGVALYRSIGCDIEHVKVTNCSLTGIGSAVSINDCNYTTVNLESATCSGSYSMHWAVLESNYTLVTNTDYNTVYIGYASGYTFGLFNKEGTHSIFTGGRQVSNSGYASIAPGGSQITIAPGLGTGGTYGVPIQSISVIATWNTTVCVSAWTADNFTVEFGNMTIGLYNYVMWTATLTGPYVTYYTGSTWTSYGPSYIRNFYSLG